MFVRLGQVLLVVALLVATGGHWALLQTVAWTNMLAHNLRTTSMVDALANTFDGRHPCELCKDISAAKKSEKKSDLPNAGKKLEFVCARPAFVFFTPTDYYLLTMPAELMASWVETPPTPPPIAV